MTGPLSGGRSRWCLRPHQRKLPVAHELRRLQAANAPPTAVDLAATLTAVWRAFGDSAWTCRDLVAAGIVADDETRPLGFALQAAVGRPVGHFAVQRLGTDRQGRVWSIRMR